jgi:hypothetical protein
MAVWRGISANKLIQPTIQPTKPETGSLASSRSNTSRLIMAGL